jgi:hypothetical protein
MPLAARHWAAMLRRASHYHIMTTEITNLLAGSAAVLCVLAAGCGKQQSTLGNDEADTQSQEALIARIDKHGDEVMASAAKAEARQWMKQPSHVFFKADPKQVAQFVEEFYGAGATQVLIVDVEEHEGTQYGESLLVVLPKEAQARAKLFEVGGRADTAFDNDPVTDKGQKYLYYSLD